MDPSLRSNGSNTRLPTQPSVRTAGRSRLAGRVERVLNSALAGERAAVLNAASAELLADPVAVAAVFESALDRPGVGVLGHFMAHELLRRSGLHDDLLNAPPSPHPAAGARAGPQRPAAGRAGDRQAEGYDGRPFRRRRPPSSGGGGSRPAGKEACRRSFPPPPGAGGEKAAMRLPEGFDRRYQQTPAT